jgi:hypothetical protein
MALLLAVERPGLASTLTQSRHPHAGLRAFALLATEVAVSGDRTALPTDDGLALPARRALDAPFLDSHALLSSALH